MPILLYYNLGKILGVVTEKYGKIPSFHELLGLRESLMLVNANCQSI